MPLRLLLPPTDRPGADAAVDWCLVDARGIAQRDGHSPLAGLPRGEPVEAILPASRVLFARLKLPKVGAATLRELLPYAVEDRLLADPANIHAVPGAPLANGETLVAIVDRAWLESALAWLAGHELRVARVLCETALAPEATAAAGTWFAKLSREASFLVEPDGRATAFDAPADGAPAFSLRVAMNEARERGTLPVAIHVEAAAGIAPPDAKAWEAALECPVAVHAARGPLSGAVAENAIDLLTPALARRHSRAGRFALPRAAWALAVGVLALHVGLIAFDTWRLERERAALEAEREALFRAAFPEARAVVDPALQMRRNLADLRRSRGEGEASEFLTAAAQAAQGGAVPVRRITYDKGKLAVERGAGTP